MRARIRTSKSKTTLRQKTQLSGQTSLMVDAEAGHSPLQHNVAPQLLSPSRTLLQMQQQYGNHFVQRLVERARQGKGNGGLEQMGGRSMARRIPIADLQTIAVQRVAPAVVPIVIWFGKALAATSIDALIDLAIAAITGMPPPGFWSHVGNFFVNLVPGLSEAKKVKKAAKLFRVIDKILDIVKAFKKLNVPGASNLLQRMSKEVAHFKDAISGGNLAKAKEAFGRLVGFLREAQVASKLKEEGAKIVHLGKNIKVGKRIATEVDAVTQEAGRMVFNQVKAGKRAVLTPGSTDWVKFTNQVDETIKAAQGLKAKVRYVVDEISAEAQQYLTSKGVEIRRTSEILK